MAKIVASTSTGHWSFNSFREPQVQPESPRGSRFSQLPVRTLVTASEGWLSRDAMPASAAVRGKPQLSPGAAQSYESGLSAASRRGGGLKHIADRRLAR